MVTSLADVLGSNSEPISATRMASSEDYNKAGEIYRRKAKAFRNIFVPQQSQYRLASAADDAFVFADNVGTYAFVRADTSWSYSATPTDQIILNFPSDTTSSINDATVTIYGYTEERHIEEPGTAFADTSYMPTFIDAELTLGATKYVDVNFTAAYNAEGHPTSMNYTLYLKPFTNTFSYTDGGSTVDIVASVAKDGEGANIVSTSATVTFFDATKDSALSVSGYTQYRRVKLSGSIDFAAIAEEDQNMGSVSVATYNSSVNIDIIDNSNGQVVGHIEFFDNAGSVDIQVRFPDNTTKLASEYFDPLVSELETFMTSVE